MAERKSISPRLRFEIFKRDKFTCRYCGRSTPAVILEIDHIVPVAEGGADDRDNLVTSCFECNRGKGAALLHEMPPADEDIHERAVLLAEREMQLREYNELLRLIREREERDVHELLLYWCSLWHLEPGNVPQYAIPDSLSLQRFLREIAAEDVHRAMLSAARNGRSRTPYQACKYLYAILHNWRREGIND